MASELMQASYAFDVHESTVYDVVNVVRRCGGDGDGECERYDKPHM